MTVGAAVFDDAEIDFAIAGSGSGALTAAIVAHDAGLRVAIYEKASVVGGGTAYSGGVIWAPCNHMMSRKRIDDSPEAAVEYLRHASGGRGDEALARRYVDNVGPIVAQVEEWTGIRWVIWPGQPDYYPSLPGACLNGRAVLPHPNSADQVLTPAEERLPAMSLVRQTPHMDFVPGFQRAERPAREAWVAGRSIIGGLWKCVLEREIPYYVDTAVRSLITDNGTVLGIVVEGPDGQPRRILAERGVLLNTGGFDWDTALSRRYLPGPPVFAQTPPSNTGDGLRMAMGLGAATALMDKALWHPAIMIPGDVHDTGEQLYRMFNAELSKPHSVVVNRSGHRFVSEAAYYAMADAWFEIDWRDREYANLPSYFVADEQYRRKYGMPGVRDGEPVPDWITQAGSLEALAGALGIDPAGLTEEVARYNADCLAGSDSRFRRGEMAYERYWGDPDHDGPNPTMGPVTEPPFHAFPLYLTHAGTRGGVLIDRSARVQSVEGKVIPGLYACGNTAANLLFGAGYGSGSAVGSSMVFGYLAAQNVTGADQ
jgi:3-oxosteroid 1-dehydrogenase